MTPGCFSANEGIRFDLYTTDDLQVRGSAAPALRALTGLVAVLMTTLITGWQSPTASAQIDRSGPIPYTVIHSFSSAARDGSGPGYNTLTQGTDDYLYGVTQNGGANGVGSVY